MREIEIGKTYRHFKGNLYRVVDVAECTETGERMVVYRALYGKNKLWVRPYEMFASKVDKKKYPEIKQKYRFERVKIKIVDIRIKVQISL